jgi:hypothetical protein
VRIVVFLLQTPWALSWAFRMTYTYVIHILSDTLYRRTYFRRRQFAAVSRRTLARHILRDVRPRDASSATITPTTSSSRRYFTRRTSPDDHSCYAFLSLPYRFPCTGYRSLHLPPDTFLPATVPDKFSLTDTVYVVRNTGTRDTTILRVDDRRRRSAPGEFYLTGIPTYTSPMSRYSTSLLVRFAGTQRCRRPSLTTTSPATFAGTLCRRRPLPTTSLLTIPRRGTSNLSSGTIQSMISPITPLFP